LGKFFSKAWAAAFLRDWLATHGETQALFGAPDAVGTLVATEDDARARIGALWETRRGAVLKAPWGTSGNQIKRVARPSDVTGSLRGWIRNTLRTQGGLVVEPWLDKRRDLSIQIEVRPNGDTRLLSAREFLTDARWQYRGAVLGGKFWRLQPEESRFLHAVLPAWRRLARDVGRALGDGGYRGPAGLDAMIWRTPAGALCFKPLGELNPRWTMGRVALELEHHVVPGVRAAWLFVRAGTIDVAAVEQRHPVQLVETEAGRRLRSGVFFTTDPATAREVLTVLVVGEHALASPAWRRALTL
jgi:hypothetical protein